jgi:alanine racemase
MAAMSDKWVEIDDAAILHNLDQVRSLLSASTRLIAVVKANAYGHGLVETATLLADNGVEFFAVTFLDEALKLREAGIKGAILLLSPLVDEDAVQKAIRAQITIMISSLKGASLADRVSLTEQTRLTVHLKIETGLNRFGLSDDEAEQVCKSLSRNPYIYIEGIYTHMAHAGAGHPGYTRQQFGRFMNTVRRLNDSGYTIPIRHCANSAVTLRFPEMHLDAVRVGTLLSGQYPVGDIPKPITLLDPFQYKTRIISLNQRPAGSYIGYFRNYRLGQSARIAVLPVGFIDGVAVDVVNPPAGGLDAVKKAVKILFTWLGLPGFTAQVQINGQPCTVVGKVFMQFTLIKLPEYVEAGVGTVVSLPARKTLVSPAIKRIHSRVAPGATVSSD